VDVRAKEHEDTAPAGTPPHPTLREYYEGRESRQGFLDELFDRTAHRYRALDRAIGLGSGLWYRRKALRDAGLEPGMKVLDVACGPGLTTQCALALTGSTGYVVGLDPSTGMLREARRGPCRNLIQAVAERLPFLDASFDFLSMGYALRHVSDLEAAFREYHRVLKPGGIVLLLEVSRPRSAALLSASRFYIKTAMGLTFATATGNRDMRTLMRYWWDTIEHCVTPDVILSALGEVGFARCGVREQFGGLLRNYRAVRA
jgi:demethylmenaquinone methyltransferase/2-methoxy-6-polyprenyl-1,4-benzoquinol methylase